MQHSRTSSTSSGASTGGGTGKGNNSSSNGSVIFKVLGGLRRSSHDDSTTADNKESPSWTDNYDITHRPDRPRRDKRENVKTRSSADVMGQLNKMWQRSQQMTEAKRKLKEAKGKPSIAQQQQQQQQPSIQGHRRGGSESAARGDGSNVDVVSIPSLHADLVPNFSRKPDSPSFSRFEWRAYGEENTERTTRQEESNIFWRPGSSRSTAPPSPGQMTIRVGLEVSGPFGEDELGAYDNVSLVLPTPPPVPKVFTPLTAPPGPTTVFLSPATYVPNDETQGGRVRSRSPRRQADFLTTHRSTKGLPALPSSAQTLEAQTKMSRRSANTLYLSVDQHDGTPSLTFSDSSSSVSEQLGPQTRPSSRSDADVAYEKKRGGGGHRASSQDLKWCPMPSCGIPLLMPADRDQNLCASCRSEMQPHQSTFTTPTDQSASSPELLKPTVYSPPKPTATKRAHSDDNNDYNRHPIFSETIKKKAKMPERSAPMPAPMPTSCYINGDGKTKQRPRPADDHGRGGGSYVAVDTGRIAPETGSSLAAPSPRHKKSTSTKAVSSRFNKDRECYGLSRRHTRRGRDGHVPSSPYSPRTVILQRSPASSSRYDNAGGVRHEEEEGTRGDRTPNHIGFQLAGWQISSEPSTPSPTLPLPLPTGPSRDRNQTRRYSGPLLEPKTFRPPTPPPPPPPSVTRQPKRENSILRRRPSMSRIRAGRSGKPATGNNNNNNISGSSGNMSPRSAVYKRNKLVPSPSTYRSDRRFFGSKPDTPTTKTTFNSKSNPKPKANKSKPVAAIIITSSSEDKITDKNNKNNNNNIKINFNTKNKNKNKDKDKKQKPQKRIVEAKDIYREIDSIIDSYIRLSSSSSSCGGSCGGGDCGSGIDTEQRKTEVVGSYFSAVPHDVQMRIQGFI